MTRFYFHGDASESKPGMYYCAFCDLGETRDHFFSGYHKGDHHARLALTRRALTNLKKRFPGEYSRPAEVDNIVLSEIPKPVPPRPGPFARWLKKQKDRDDPIGDLANDVSRDARFPITKNDLGLLKTHLIFQNACSEALQALEEAWAEFKAKPKARAGMSLKLRFEVFRRDDYCCQICGATAQDGVKLEVDHKTPVAKGGTDELSNLWTLCFPCNRGKGTSDL